MKKITFFILFLCALQLSAQEKTVKIHKDILNGAKRSLLIFSDLEGNISSIQELENPQLERNYELNTNAFAENSETVFTIYNEYVIRKGIQKIKYFNACSYLDLQSMDSITNKHHYGHELIDFGNFESRTVIVDGVQEVNDVYASSIYPFDPKRVSLENNSLSVLFENGPNTGIYLSLKANNDDTLRYFNPNTDDALKIFKVDIKSFKTGFIPMKLSLPDTSGWNVFVSTRNRFSNKTFSVFHKEKCKSADLIIEVPKDNSFEHFGLHINQMINIEAGFISKRYWYVLDSTFSVPTLRPINFSYNYTLKEGGGFHLVGQGTNVDLELQFLLRTGRVPKSMYEHTRKRNSTWYVKGILNHSKSFVFPKLTKKQCSFTKQIKRLKKKGKPYAVNLSEFIDNKLYRSLYIHNNNHYIGFKYKSLTR